MNMPVSLNQTRGFRSCVQAPPLNFSKSFVEVVLHLLVGLGLDNAVTDKFLGLGSTRLVVLAALVLGCSAGS